MPLPAVISQDND